VKHRRQTRWRTCLDLERQWLRPAGTAAEVYRIYVVRGQLPANTSFTGAVLGIPALTAVHTVLGAGPGLSNKY
jgi:hypothetical protein